MIKKIDKKILNYLVPFFIGCLTSFSLPPYNFIFINFLTFPILLFILIQIQKNNSLWLGFKVGWLFGFGYFLSNIYWIAHSLTFEEIFKPLIPFSLVLIPSFLALFYGFATFIISKFRLKLNFSSILIFSIFFSFVEFSRGFILSGFPWNLIVYSWSNYLNSLQILSIIGTYSFNLISITIFLLPIVIFFKNTIKFKTISLTILIFIIFSNNFYGYWKIRKDKNLNNKNLDFEIKIISPKISIKNFFDYNYQDNILQELIKLSEPDPSVKTIFIWPEGVLSKTYLSQVENFSDHFSESHFIITGIRIQKKENKNHKIYNSMVVLDYKLNLLAEYNKIKLVPFGEFLPFEKILKKTGLKKITHGYHSFSSGKKRELISIFDESFNFIPLICYEIIYSGNIIPKLENNFNFIVNVSEDGWFGNSIGPYQHFSHSIFRSIEEGKNIVRSANNGISAHIDPNGRIIKRIESTKKGIIQIKNFKIVEKTFFSKFGNKIFFYFLIFYISLLFFIYKKER